MNQNVGWRTSKQLNQGNEYQRGNILGDTVLLGLRGNGSSESDKMQKL